jgi:hypothetical protein
MSKLPWLYDLVRLTVFVGHDSYRIFYGNSWAIRLRKSHEKLNASLLSPVCTLFRKPSRA